jgi:hypothetical protein
MLKSEVIVVPISRPYEEVNAFCADPMNFARWATDPDSVMEPLSRNEYIVQLPQGRRVMRFAPPNHFGILDYQVFEIGETDGWTRPVRLVRNGDGTDLQVTWIQQPGVSDEQFRSEIEWLRSDVQRLKSLLESI